MKKIVYLAAIMLMAVSCAQIDIAGKWNIVKVNGEAVSVVGERTPFMEFNAERSMVHGFTGCNIMNGSYSLDGKKLSLGNMATTMMAGPEQNMKTEQAVLAAMKEAASVKVSGNSLKILDAKGTAVIELAKQALPE